MQYYLNPKFNYINEKENLLLNETQHHSIVNDIKLSWQAKGLLLQCFCMDEKYFTLYDLVQTAKGGIYSASSGIKELIQNEYIYEKEVLKGEGCVYILSDNYGNYKIGMAIDMEKRLRSYNTHLPYSPIIIRIIQNLNMRNLEKVLHEKFKSKHIRNEWYKLDTDDIEYIKSL